MSSASVHAARHATQHVPRTIRIHRTALPHNFEGCGQFWVITAASHHDPTTCPTLAAPSTPAPFSVAPAVLQGFGHASRISSMGSRDGPNASAHRPANVNAEGSRQNSRVSTIAPGSIRRDSPSISDASCSHVRRRLHRPRPQVGQPFPLMEWGEIGRNASHSSSTHCPAPPCAPMATNKAQSLVTSRQRSHTCECLAIQLGH